MTKNIEEPENIKLANNIKYFRKHSGETQQDLALAIEISESAISNYETYQRVPDIAIINKIANHYNITVNQLINGTYSDPQCIIPKIEKMINDSSFLNMFSELIMPMECSDTSLENNDFKKAYKIQCAFKEMIAKGLYTDIDIDEMIKCYNESIDLSESKANLISFYIVIDIAEHNSVAIKGIEKLKKKKIDIKKYYKNYCLKNEDISCFFDDDTESINLDELDEEITGLLRDLRKDNNYAFLVNYFIMLRYWFNCIDNDQPRAINIIVANEMMWSELFIFNPFVTRFYFEYIDKFLNLTEREGQA